MNQLPKKITPCPIHEAVFEIRFNSDMPDDAIFGIVFSAFKESYNNQASELAILQIPSAMRVSDPNLKFAPHYKMENDNFLMQIGPKVVSLSNTRPYQGWEKFKKEIIELFDRLKALNIFKNVNRVSLRYINIFAEMDIFDQSNIQVMLENNPIESGNISLSTQIKNDSIISQIKVISGAQIKLENELINGSLIDIDSFINTSENDSQSLLNESFIQKIDALHNEEKILFYKILGQNHYKELSPEYEYAS